MGAKITAQLRSKDCAPVSKQRLVSITNTADPLFMVEQWLSACLATRAGSRHSSAHYSARILLGFVMRFYGRRGTETSARPSEAGLLSHAVNELVSARESDGRSIGHLLGDAVHESVKTLLLVGGFIMVFSVVTRILALAGVTHLIATPLGVALRRFGVEPSILDALVKGFFEITIGCQEASMASASIATQLIAISAIIGWSGLSVCAQVASLVHEAGIRLHAYLSARVIHAVLSAVACALLLRLQPFSVPAAELQASATRLVYQPSAIGTLIGSTKLLAGALAVTSVCALLVSLPASLRVVRFFYSSKK